MLTVPEVAELLRISEELVRRLTRSGELVGYKIGREFRYYKEDVDAYIASRRTRPAQPTSPASQDSSPAASEQSE